MITAEKKGDQEKNDVGCRVADAEDAFKDNGIEVVEVEARPEFEVMTPPATCCMIKEGAVGHFATRSVRWRPAYRRS